ncbi:MAG TPA: extracellular solute-binding protein [Caldilineaceae bacterium]|nr:extracellular solute-binding protein [Caldilineaceae bacterium]
MIPIRLRPVSGHHSRWTAGLLLLILLLAGCAAPAAPGGAGTAGEEAAAEKVTITFWFNPPSGGEAANCMVETAINPFNEQNDQIFVEAVAQPNAWDATRTAIAGGGGPDVVVTPGPSFVFELAKAGQLLPLDDFVESEGWGDIFVPWALSLGEVDGVLYSLPHELETLVLYYNKTLFEQNGWEPPTTMEELVALSEQIDAAGIIPFAHSNAEWRPANEWFVGEFLNHVAGPEKVYQALTGQISWEDPDFVTAIAMLNDMQQNGWFMGGLDLYYTTPTADRQAAFGNGEAAMNIEGSWFLGDISTYFGEAAGNQNDWEWVPVPSTSGEAIFDLGIGSTYSINRATQHPEAVAEFLTYLFSPATQGELLAKCQSAPAPVRLEADALTGIDPRAARLFEALGQASDAGNYGYTTWTFWPPKSDVYIYEEIEKVWAGDMTPEEYMAGHQALFAQELEAGDIPPIPER